MKKIRSAYIAKIIFSLTSKKKKLNIVKYSKFSRKKLDIIKRQYKTSSTTFIVYETRTKGKQYISKTKKLIFYGEFLNSKRNGEWKNLSKTEKKIWRSIYKWRKEWKRKRILWKWKNEIWRQIQKWTKKWNRTFIL